MPSYLSGHIQVRNHTWCEWRENKFINSVWGLVWLQVNMKDVWVCVRVWVSVRAGVSVWTIAFWCRTGFLEAWDFGDLTGLGLFSCWKCVLASGAFVAQNRVLRNPEGGWTWACGYLRSYPGGWMDVFGFSKMAKLTGWVCVIWVLSCWSAVKVSVWAGRLWIGPVSGYVLILHYVGNRTLKQLDTRFRNIPFQQHSNTNMATGLLTFGKMNKILL